LNRKVIIDVIFIDAYYYVDNKFFLFTAIIIILILKNLRLNI